jgi:hypothetical protein
MEDVTLVNGRTMTDPDWVEEFGLGDVLTDFIPTKDDLIDLADGLVDHVLTNEYFSMFGGSLRDFDRMQYNRGRLSRVIEFIESHKPDDHDQFEHDQLRLRCIEKKLRRGRADNALARTEFEKDPAKYEEEHFKKVQP